MSTLTAHQREILKKNIEKNNQVTQLCHAEMGANRTLRTQAIQTAMSIAQSKKTVLEDKRVVPQDVNIDDVLTDAQKIYNFYMRDGKLEDLATESLIKAV